MKRKGMISGLSGRFLSYSLMTTPCIKEFSHQHFMLCVFASDAAHVITAGFAGVDVHGLKVPV
jgi:hypothetical protein